MTGRTAGAWTGLVCIVVATSMSWSVRASDHAADGPRPVRATARRTLVDLDSATRAGIAEARRQARVGADPSALIFANPEEQLTATIAPGSASIVGRGGASVRFDNARLGRARFGSAGAETLRTLTSGAVSGVGTARLSVERAAGDIPVTEWWTNTPDGIEQGFTVASRPAGDGLLEVEQRWTSRLRATASADGVGLTFVDENGPRLTFDGIRAWDAHGHDLPARMHVNAERQTLAMRVDDGGAAYPITIDPVWRQQAYLKASNTATSDFFGSSVAVSGDTIVVGATGEDSNSIADQTNNAASSAGAAYVFVRSGSSWTQQAYLKASNPGASDFFGHSVAISGDTIVVGAYGEASSSTVVNGDGADNSAGASGAAYVFVRNGSTWSQQAYLKASNAGAADQFGISVGISGDTIVVGAYGEASSATGVNGNGADNSAPSSGAAYVFVRSGGSWSPQAYLKASNPGTSDVFGYSVAIDGNTIVVGAYGEDSNATGIGGNQADNSADFAGAAYVFVRSGVTWTQQAYLKASNTGANDNFGECVDISGDTIVVGAYGESSSAVGVNGNQADNSAASSGAAYVFVRSGSTWTQQAFLKASNTGTGDGFGGAVAVSGDAIVVGAAAEASNASGVNGDQTNNSVGFSGAAYVFVRTGVEWTQQAYVKAATPEASDSVGSAVAISGPTVVTGAYLEDSNATGVDGNQGNNSASNAGAAYVFRLGERPSVDLDGDFNGDAFIYSSTVGNWAFQVTTAGGAFSGLNGAWAPVWTVASARFNTDDLTDVFVFDQSNGQWFTMYNVNGDFAPQVFGAWGTNWQRFLVDLNGDNRTDVFLWDPARGEWFQCLSNGIGNFVYTHGFWSTGWELYPVQLNGDGRQDFFLFNRSNGQWFWAVSGPGGTFTYPQSGFWSTDWVIYPGDYTGGGITDLLLYRPSTGFWFVAKAGTGFTYTSGFFTPGYAIYPTDVDADGRSDLFLHNPTTGQWFDLVSNGTGGFTNAAGGQWSTGWNLYPTDLNGDGRSDMLLYNPSNGQWFQARNLALGTFNYTSGFWSSGLTIFATAPHSGN